LQGIFDQRIGRSLLRGRNRIWIAQGLRRHPVLAIGAVQIASEHAEAVGKRTGISVEERLLLNGIALHAADISPGHVESSALVVANFANSGLSFWDGATVPTGETADAIAIQLFVKIGISYLNVPVEDVAKSGHNRPWGHCNPSNLGENDQRWIYSQRYGFGKILRGRSELDPECPASAQG
jgi:hypothetical protein